MKLKNIILDLDNTLISAEAYEDVDHNEKMRKDLLKKEDKFDNHDMDGYYIVFERPGVQEFLDYLFENFNVSIWTAATKDYAIFVIEKVILKKPSRKIDMICFSYHCDISKKKYKNSKKLDLWWNEFGLEDYNKKNTLIIDDLDEVYDCQPKNAIRIKPFEITDADAEKDVELKNIKKFLKK